MRKVFALHATSVPVLLRFPDRSIGTVKELHAAVIEYLPDPVGFCPVFARPRLVPEMDQLFDPLNRDRDLAVRQPPFFEPLLGAAKENAEGLADVLEGSQRRGQDDLAPLLVLFVRFAQELVRSSRTRS